MSTFITYVKCSSVSSGTRFSSTSVQLSIYLPFFDSFKYTPCFNESTDVNFITNFLPSALYVGNSYA